MRYVKLSYSINKKMPLYPGTKTLNMRRAKAIKKGDFCNTFDITFSNHTGTHVDAPRHFFDSGRALSEYSLKELIFTKPILINCPKDACETIGPEDLEALKRYSRERYNFLLLRTGFSKFIKKNPYKYTHENPFLSPEAAVWIRKHFPSIRAIGIDCISIGSYSDKGKSRKTHRILLKKGAFKAAPILIVEDLYIPSNTGQFDEIIIVPLFIEGVDSAPCTVLGVSHD